MKRKPRLRTRFAMKTCRPGVLVVASASLFWSAASPAASPSDIARSRPWLRLLEYKEDQLPSRSVALNPEFFASPEGNHDPLAELTTLARYFADGSILHPIRQEPWACIFPARFAYLKQALAADWKTPRCGDFDSWRSRFPDEHVALVFSSAYKGNPASIFGHTFLVFNSDNDLAHDGRGSLLGYAVAFLADTQGDDNPLTYTFNGIFGGFQGKFDVQTYYETVNNYNNAENRDLWEYPLNLSAGERDLLIRHLWEVSQSGHFKYYFFDENCSWHMLSLLEAAKPDLRLKSRSGWVTIPSETVRHLSRQQNPTPAPRWRPSLRKKVDAYFSRLTPEERDVARNLAAGDRPSRPPRPEIWDAAIMDGNWRAQKSSQPMTNEQRLEFRKLLTDRARQPVSSSEPTPEANRNQPDLGHNLRFYELGLTRFSAEPETHQRLSPIFGLGLGFSDRLASDLGFEPDSGIRVLTAKIRWDQQAKSPRLLDSTIIAVETYAPWTALDPRWSWLLGLTANENRFNKATDLIGEGGVGITIALGTLRSRVMAVGQLITTDSFRRADQRVQAGPQIMFARSSATHSLELSISRKHNMLKHSDWSIEDVASGSAVIYLNTQLEWRLSATRLRAQKKSGLELTENAIETSLRSYF